MHSWEQLRTALANPRRLVRGVAHPKRRLLEVHDTVMRHAASERAGVDIPAADWDNLLILDACRYDVFAAADGLDGTLKPVYSRASRTSEFLRVNYAGGTHRDTVYVTANPMHTSIAGVDEAFSEIVPVWQLLRAGHLSRAGAFEAYRESLDVALPHVERALAALPGRSVVTADHGEAFGERGPFGLRVYGHPGRVFMDELVRVPWLEVPADERKTIREADTGPSEVSYDDVGERLEHLGYA